MGLDHAVPLSRFACFLQENELSGQALNGNGGVQRFLLARAQMKSTVSVILSRSLKWACLAMCLATAIVYGTYLSNSGLEPMFAAAAFGVYVYAVWLIIKVAEDIGQPFGQGVSKVALRERFQSYNERIEVLCRIEVP